MLSVFLAEDILVAMRLFGGTNRTVWALTLNAVILFFILLAITTRDSRLFSGADALGQTTPTSAGNITVMPGQLSLNTWGCYLVDSQNQTLSVYEYSHNNLRLAASRNIQYDRRLGLFNTTPSPLVIKSKVERGEEQSIAAPTTNPLPETSTDR